MSKKADAWVVVRLDGPAQEHSDYVGVKGVYDSAADAQAAAERASKAKTFDGTQYLVIPSRRILRESKSGPEELAKTLKSFTPLDAAATSWVPFPLHDPFAAILDRLPSAVRVRVLQPLVTHFAEMAVARALDGVVAKPSTPGPDIRLPDGRTVEVKVLFLDPSRPRAPFVQYRAGWSDSLAVILVTPELQVAAARLIPATVLQHFERPGPHSREAKLINLRVTPDLLGAPGTLPIDLGA